MNIAYEPEVSIEEARTILDIEESVMAKITSMGLGIPGKPVYADATGASHYFEGDIPHDLTQLTDQQLGFYMSMVTAWMSYVGGQKTLADMRKTIAREQLEVFEAKLRISNKADEEGKRRSNPERDDIVRKHRQIVEARSAYIQLEAIYKFTVTIFNGAEQKFAAISRRITQTTNTHSNNNRSTNVQNQPQPGGHPLFRGGRAS